MKTLRLLGLAAIVAASFVTQSAHSATELTFGHCTTVDDPYHIGAVKFSELVAGYTNNNVKIRIVPGCQLATGDREFIEAVKLGTVDLTVTASAPIVGFDPKFMLFDLPFLFRDNAHAHTVLDGPIGEKVSASLESQGIKVVAWMESGFRNMITSKKDVVTPDDMKGVKFRVMENPVYVSMFKNLGATGVPIPAPEVYTSLQTGVVDGYEHPIGAYLALKAYEVAKKVALTGHTYTPAPVLMNLAVFKKLSAADQAAVLRAGREAAKFEREYVAKTMTQFQETLKKQGVVFVAVDKPAFQAKMAPVYREFEGKVGKDLIDGVIATK